MNQFIVLIAGLILHAKAHAAPSFAGAERSYPPVIITKDVNADGRKCEIKGVVLHTKSMPHSNEIANRLILELRKPRGSYQECPASVAVNLDSRGEVMKLYELTKSAEKVVCQSSSAISGAHVTLTCDGAFELRSEN